MSGGVGGCQGQDIRSSELVSQYEHHTEGNDSESVDIPDSYAPVPHACCVDRFDKTKTKT